MVCVVVNGKFVLGVIYKLFFEYIVWVMVDGGLNVKVCFFYNEKILRIVVFCFYLGMVRQVVFQIFGNQIIIILVGGVGYKVLVFLDVFDKS